jgi:oligoribonuclease NrnB/cAMP/cGMP phosphodiesterase (DHH superfamily)
MSRHRTEVLIAYHENCIDGFTSAWVAARAREKKGERITLLPMGYNKESVENLFIELRHRAYDQLLVVDYSLDLQVLERLHMTTSLRVRILDHHKTAFEKYCPDMTVTSTSEWRGKVHDAHVILDNAESGASLCWRYFNNSDLPVLISYVKDYDLWTFKYGEDTKYINKYIRSLYMNLDVWDDLAIMLSTLDGRDEALAEGARLQGIHMDRVHALAEGAVPITLLDRDGLTVECPVEYTSDVGHALATKCGTYGAMFFQDEDSGKTKWSLRSNPPYDVSVIARSFGGGGHLTAAGFEVTHTRGEDV